MSRQPEEIERALLISNKSHVQRMEKIEQNLLQLTENLMQSNQIIRKLYQDNENIQKRLSELESFANQIIEANKAATILLKSTKNTGESDPNRNH